MKSKWMHIVLSTFVASFALSGASVANGSSASSYDVSEDDFEPISEAVPTARTAAAWVAATKNGNYAYTANVGSDSILAYELSPDGELTLRNSVAGFTGAGSRPSDLALSHNGKFLYALTNGTQTISAFAVGSDGSLTAVNGAVGLPATAAGLAAW